MSSQITAIVPTYNRADLLPETLDALACQSLPLDEIIVWDDGSSDATSDVVAEFAAAHKMPLRYFKAENAGKSRALNAAMAEATGAYVWICDDDDVARHDAAARMKDAIERSGAPISAGRHTRFSIDEASGERQDQGTGYWPDLSEGSVARHVLEDIFFFQNAMLVRRECYDHVGPFREDLARSIDYDMIARLVSQFPVAMIDGVLFDQRKHDGARGPAAARHAAAQSEAVWLKNDQAVFEKLYTSVPISFYEAMFAAEADDVKHRAGLLQRACIYARRSDWKRALDDLAAAIDACPDRPLSAVEEGICRRAMSGKHGCREALSNPVSGELRALAGKGTAGTSVLVALGRGVVWRIRDAIAKRDLSHAVDLSMFYFGSFPSVLKQVTSIAGKPAPEVKELSDLPEEAYQW